MEREIIKELYILVMVPWVSGLQNVQMTQPRIRMGNNLLGCLILLSLDKKAIIIGFYIHIRMDLSTMKQDHQIIRLL